MKSRFYILLPVHNRRAITQQFVVCLRQQTVDDYHLVLIDDGSEDGTADMVREFISSLTVITGKGNWWWAGCLQQGLNWLEEQDLQNNDIVVFTNDDVLFDSRFLENAERILNANPETLLLPHLQDLDNKQILPTGVEVDFSKLIFRDSTISEKVNCLSTRGLFMRWGDLRRVGRFYPVLLPHYLSDYEFTMRAHRKGLKLLSSPSLVITANLEATGYRNLDGIGFAQFLKRYFSKKSVGNPVYWTVFILLACPLRWIPLNVFRVWKIAVFTMLKSVGESIAVR